MTPLRVKRAGRAATALAAASVLMVITGLSAAFAPASVFHHTPAADPPPSHPVASTSASHSSSASPSSDPSPSADPPSSAPATFPAPVQPAPLTYPPAPARTYPAPPRRTYPPPSPRPSPSPGSDLPPPGVLTPPLAGVVTSDVPAWDAATASRAQLAVNYVSMSVPLAPTFLHSVMRVDGTAEPVIELMPTSPGQPTNSLEQIAAGGDDPWLRALAKQIATLGRPVVLSFAPEANGSWYAWADDPAGFVQAWQHVHAIVGTSNVTWLWVVSAHNIGDPATQDIGAYWPGTGVVDWAGLDGYYYSPGDSFALRFNHSLSEIERWWSGPIIISETAVSPAVGPDQPTMAADIADLFHGVATDHLLGLIYFDLKPACPPECGFYHPDFRLEQYPAALTAYRQAVSGAW